MYSIVPPRGARPGQTRSGEPPEVARRREAFDAHAEELAELRREALVLREMQLEQMKHDDEIVKEWIRLI